MKDIEQVVNRLKNKNTRDREMMSNKMLKNMGKDMKESLKTLINEIEEQIVTPNEWNKMGIISVNKAKGNKSSLENRRGLFITNSVSKVFEKLRLGNINDKIEEKISRFQCGGISGRSVIDHLITLNAVIDYNRHLGAPTYIWFGDAVKCFDKLCLEDCIKELGRIVGWEEAALIYEMNKYGQAEIETPVGKTKEIEIEGRVKQGTIFGPKLCAITTDKVNKVGQKSVTMIREIEVEALIFVDDIMFPSSRKSGVETAISNCSSLEKLKDFTFSNSPAKSGVLVIGKKEEKRPIRSRVKKGEIQLLAEYKYLGEWYSETGGHKLSIEKRKEKTELMVQEILKYGDESKVGTMALEVRLKIFETVVVPTIFANVETWGSIKEEEIKELERIQGKIIRRILEQVATTPYWGLIAETGIWPVRQRLEYKKVMLFHNIITSNSKRLVKELVEDQIRRPYKGCWGESVKEICTKYNLKEDEIAQYTKQDLKKEIKAKIAKEIEEKIGQKKLEMTKLRFTDGKGKKEYIERLNTKEAIIMLKARLNMLELKSNYKSKYQDLTCELCGEGEDKTEHLFHCKALGKLNRKSFSVEDLENPSRDLARYLIDVIALRKLGDGIVAAGVNDS